MNINSVTQSLRIREYYYMLLRHKLVLFLSVLLAVTVSVFVAFSMPKVYKAETVLMTESENILQPLIGNLVISPSHRARMRALREQMLSWPKLSLLAEKLKLDKNVKNPFQYEKMINTLRENIGIRVRSGGLINVSFQGDSPEKVQEVVKTLSSIIVEGALTSTNLETNSAILFLEEQLDEYQKKLETAEAELREFQEIYAFTLPLATRMNERLVNLKLELQNLLVQNTEAHPRVIQTRQLIEEVERQRDAQMEAAKSAGLDITKSQYADLISSAPLQRQMMAKLQRDYNVNNDMYQSLRRKLETARLSQTLEEADKGLRFKVLEPARLPLKPFKPNKPLILMAGLAGGFGIGIGLIFLIELSNNSIRNVEDARRLLDLPIFGSIATIKPEELLLGERLRAEAGV